MTENATTEKQAEGPPDARLSQLAAAVGATKTRGPAPVDSWHPPYCGEIDMRIAADGAWFYAGTPITRRPLIELFAGILRKDPERHVLVTPVECVGIIVEDAPFAAVAMVVDHGRFRFATNVGDEVEADAEHPMRFVVDEEDGIKPYIRIRGDLWARLTRSLAIDLVEAAVIEAVDGCDCLGVRSGDVFFPIGPADAA